MPGLASRGGATRLASDWSFPTGQGRLRLGTTREHGVAGEEGVAATLARITAGWMEQRWDELRERFDPRMVMVLPGFSGRLEGREAVVAHYRELMERVAVTDYREDSPEIDVWESTATATVRWRMEWTDAGRPGRHSGRDLFVLAYDPDQGEWRALWRTMILDPAPDAVE